MVSERNMIVIEPGQNHKQQLVTCTECGEIKISVIRRQIVIICRPVLVFIKVFVVLLLIAKFLEFVH